jgi:hypothetical protein
MDGDEVDRMLLGESLDAGLHADRDEHIGALRGPGCMADLHLAVLREVLALRLCEGVRDVGQVYADQCDGKDGKRQGRHPNPALLPSVLHFDPPEHVGLGERN